VVFAGDISLPYPGALRLVGLPAELRRATWFANLEGSLVATPGDLGRRAVFNHVEALLEIAATIRLGGVTLANNHVLDAAPLAETRRWLLAHQIACCGAGAELDDAAAPATLDDDGRSVVVMAFGWKVIRCKTAPRRSGGVNPLQSEYVLRAFERLAKSNPAARKVVFFHWGYELDNAPQPAHRDLAMRLVENGADAIVGCHAHLVQGAELHRGKPIVYGLGNFMFAQGLYHGGRLSFPADSDTGIAFETDLAGRHHVHTLRYSRSDGTVSYSGGAELSGSRLIAERTPYAGATSADYARWFRLHRRQRRALPIYYDTDQRAATAAKDGFVWVRDAAIRALLSLGLR